MQSPAPGDAARHPGEIERRVPAFDEILERIADGFVAIDRDWRYTYVNPSAARMLGKTVEELVGRQLFAVFPEVRGTTFHRAFETALATQMPVLAEGFYAPWSRWYENRVYPSATGVSVFFSDITARKLAQEAVARSKAEAEAALERLHAIQSITDSALGRLGFDELLGELLSRLRAALAAEHVTVLLLDEDGAILRPRAVDGRPPDSIAGLRIPLGSGFSGKIAAEDRAVIAADAEAAVLDGVAPRASSADAPCSPAAMGAPLRAGGKVKGVVVVGADRRGPFTPADLQLLCVVADRVAPVIERERLLETVRAAQDRLAALSRRLLTALEEQRRRIAAELHDELGQALTAVKINLGSLEQAAGRPAASASLREAIASIDHALERVRDLALDLRPAVLDDLGLPAALRWHADRIARHAGLEAHMAIDEVPRLAPAVETACFRVAQEALTNVARHAGASRVWIALRLEAGSLELQVRDDGVGFEPSAARERAAGGSSLGLLGMEERASLAGGELRLVARPGAGTEVRARFDARGARAGDP